MRWDVIVIAAAILLGGVSLSSAQIPATDDQPSPPRASNPEDDTKDQQVLENIDRAMGEAAGRNRTQALGLRTVLQYMLGHPNSATTQLDRETEQDSEGSLAHLRDAMTNIDSGDLVSASADVDEALKRNPKLQSALLLRGMIDQELNNGKASDDFAELAALAGNSALGRWSAAVSAYLKKNFGEAVRQADAAIEADPDFAYTYIIRGYAFGMQKNMVQAFHDFERALRLLPDVPAAYIGLCMARVGNHDRQQAVVACDTAASLAPDFAPIHATRAYAHLEVGDFNTALAESDRTIASMPDEPNGYLLRGAIRGRMHDNRGEIADVNSALAVKPDNADAYAMRCDAYYSLKLMAAAKSDCDHALALKPGHYGALVDRSLVESALNDFDAAVADAKAAIAGDPTNACGYDDLGKIYADHGNEDLAGAALDKAVLMDPGDGDGYVTRASVDLFQHDFAKTFSDARTAARLGFGSALMSALEGYSAIALDRYADAVTAFRRRLEQEPNSNYAALWLALAELKSGNVLDDALRQKLGQINPIGWTGVLAQMFLDKNDVDAVNAYVAAGSSPGRANLGCEAGFYTGEKLLLQNKRELAEVAFRSAVGFCPRSSPSGAVAAAELASLQR